MQNVAVLKSVIVPILSPQPPEKREKTKISMEKADREGGIKWEAWDCGSPLYDSFEVASVGHLIERHALALVSPGGSMRFPAAVSDVSGKSNGEKMKVGVVGALFRFLGMKPHRKRKGNKGKGAVKGGLFYGRFCVN